MAKTKSTASKAATTVAPKSTTAAKPQVTAAEPKKNEATKNTVSKKAAAKTTAETASTKAARKETTVKSSITLQINGIDFDPLKIQNDAVEAAKKIKADVKDVKVYIKTDEFAAYFTVDGEGSGDYKINL